MARNIGKYTTSTSNYLGSGSAGRVEKARDTQLNIDVVLKQIPKSILKDDEAIELALIDELKMFQKLNSPNIVKLLDVFKHENTFYVVQEYCQQNLQQFLKSGKMSEKDAQKMLIDLLEGFTELNKHGIIHRDLKLQNIMVQDGIFKLADCGFTKCLESFRKESLQISQFLYSSLQVVSGDKYTNKCDIWSIGIILHQAIYGYTPWFGKNIEEYQNQLTNPIIDFTGNKAILSNEMKSFIEGCLVVEEDQRFNWDDIFKHKLVSEHFKNYRSKIKEDQIKFLMNDVRQKIIKQNLDIIQLFNELDVNGDKTLEFKELFGLLRTIDKNLTQNDCKVIFQQLDLDGDKTISFDEFAKWLTDNNTKMTLLTKKFHRQSTKKLDGQPFIQPNQHSTSPIHRGNQQQNQNFQNIPQPQAGSPPFFQQDLLLQQQFNQIQNNYNPEQIILYIKELLLSLKINLYDLFIKFDTNKDGFLNYQEYFVMMKSINQMFTNDDLQITFLIFDINDDNFISFNELKTILDITTNQRLRLPIQPLQQNLPQVYNDQVPFFGQQQINNNNNPIPFNIPQQQQQQQQQQQPYQIPQQQYQQPQQQYQQMNYQNQMQLQQGFASPQQQQNDQDIIFQLLN